MYKGIEENEVAHMIDENIHYYVGEQYGHNDCWLFRAGELCNRSVAMRDFNDVEREIGTGILKEIKNRAISQTIINNITYFVVPYEEVIDVYDTYEYESNEMER